MKLSTIDEIIKDLKEVRKSKNRAWIIDDNGNIRDDAIVGDVIPLLEDMKEYEVEPSEDAEYILKLVVEDYDKSDNTYNYSCNVSNDINWNEKHIDGEDYVAIMVHRFGDVRGNYTDYVLLNATMDDIFNMESVYQIKDINDRYSATICLFSNEYSVYDCYEENEVGDYYENDRDVLLEELENREE